MLSRHNSLSIFKTTTERETIEDKIPVGNELFIVSESFTDELWIMLKLFFPICIAALAEYAPQVTINLVIGRLPNATEIISIVGLARMFSNISATLILYGIISNLFTIIPQLIGANRIDLIRVHIQRSFLITFLISIPLIVIQFYAGRILYAIGEPEELQSQITQYCLYIIPNVYGKIWLAIVMRIAQGFNYNYALLAITLFVAIVMYPMNILIIRTMGYGYVGSAFVLDFASVFSFVGTAAYISYKGYLSIFYPFMCCSVSGLKQLLNLTSLKDFFSLSLPGLIQQTFEFLISQIGVILSGYVMNSELAISATIIMSLMNGISIMFCWGSFMAIGIRVGKYIGAESKEYALRSIYIGFLISGSISIVIAIFLLIFRHAISHMFTNDDEISDLVEQLIIVLAILQFLMNIYYSLIAVYRAFGLQKYAAIIVIVCYYAFSLPLTLILLFLPATSFRSETYLGSITIWSSLAFGNLLSAVALLVYLVLRVKMDVIIYESQQRMVRSTNVLQLMKSIGYYDDDDDEKNESNSEELFLQSNSESDNDYGSTGRVAINK